MSRYLLDTNIIVFLISGETDNIAPETKDILADYNNQLYTSSIVITELIQLFRLRKIRARKHKTATAIINSIEDDLFVEIPPFTRQHTETLAAIHIADGHNDPFDHSIISHAITEKLTLISSDRQFKNYTRQNLSFVFNRR